MSKVIWARIQGGITMRPSTPIFLTLLLVMMPLSGCVSDGAQGIQGESGPMGPMGQACVNGTTRMVRMIDGVDGSDGVDGVIGPVGPAGMEGNATSIDSFQLMPDPVLAWRCRPPYRIDADRDGPLHGGGQPNPTCLQWRGWRECYRSDMTGEPRMLREVRL